MGYLRRPIREGSFFFAGVLASVERFRYEDLSGDLIDDVFTKHPLQCGTCHRETQDGLNLRTSPRPGSMPSRATLRLQVWTQFVGRLGFRINLASLHADLSIPTAYLTVIYREKALPSRGRFIISAWASEAAENVDSQEQEQDSKNGRSNFQRLRYITMFWRKAMLMPWGVAMLGEFPQMGRAYFHEGRLVRLDG